MHTHNITAAAFFFFLDMLSNNYFTVTVTVIIF